jgi:hypothetical protein
MAARTSQEAVMKFLLAAFVAIGLWPALAQAQDQHRHHPAADMPLHEKFYSTWYMPDQPTKSCCNKADCYPTEIIYREGDIFARRREDGKWLRVPARKVERRRDSPDGRNHLCAPPPTSGYPTDTVFCFALGSGI